MAEKIFLITESGEFLTTEDGSFIILDEILGYPLSIILSESVEYNISLSESTEYNISLSESGGGE